MAEGCGPAVPSQLFTKSEVAVHSSQHLSHPIVWQDFLHFSYMHAF